MSGRLIVEGTLSTDQFWPDGLSDADTTKVAVNATGFHFQTSPTSPLRLTSIFETAVVRGEGTKPVIHNGSVTIRLQGIDAPELHYRPSPLSKSEKSSPSAAKFKELNKEYRQLLGESAAIALHDLLKGHGTLNCRVETRVDHPNEV
jgi:endonuclease YncB( thermonuclease family)